MSKLREYFNVVLYVVFLGLAIYLIYFAFSSSFQRGAFAGKYYPTVKQSAEGAQKKPADLRKLRIGTPEAVAAGEKLFKLNCASCHGEQGYGDGPKAASLNPRPRNFHTEKFKFGSSPLQIYATLAKGSPGTSMPAFDLLPEAERFEMVHYVRTLIPNPPDDPPELVNALPVVEAGGTAQAAKSGAAPGAPAFDTLPLALAMAQVLDTVSPGSRTFIESSTGPAYGRLCASCHGPDGRGTVEAAQVAPSRVIYLRMSLPGRGVESVLKDKLSFAKFLATGMPGVAQHRFPGLTRVEMEELYSDLQKMSKGAGQ